MSSSSPLKRVWPDFSFQNCFIKVCEIYIVDKVVMNDYADIDMVNGSGSRADH